MKQLVAFSILGLSIFSACKKSNSADAKFSTQPSFVVSNKEEKMPVWVEGKHDADVIILAVHGGPGSNVLDFRNYDGGPGFKKIEEEYLVAYWQQRASGESIGPEKPIYYTIDQYVEDCDKVVDELKTKYPNKKIVLLGHSWGGMLTSSYLLDATRSAKISAWINAAGATNGTKLFQQTIEELNTMADNKITNNENKEFWQILKDTINQNPLIANPMAYFCLEKIDQVKIKVKQMGTSGERAISSNNNLFKEIINRDNNAQAISITLPTLTLWGEYDYAVSIQQRDELLSKIGSQKVTNILFDASGHYMMFHEPEKFATSVIAFIKTL